ncbi:DUF4359 domain-containing protein [Bacillus infantis]|uniref:DUF4359 domain-containing protein n=1 Tax=Bacillus infantis TaxID=324767 RepID=UPI001CD20741|nr:DUF4359 domain-containing protein [Bacillus infantis]MCA1039281.1 DUF4359 domain-containing protein [Bacillus infantis]
MKKRSIYLFGAAVLLAVLLFMTNPSKQDYLEFSEKQTGEPLPAIVLAERTNFLLFSVYTPNVHHEQGITHLGIFSSFYQLSDGQFDDSWRMKLLDFFK